MIPIPKTKIRTCEQDANIFNFFINQFEKIADLVTEPFSSPSPTVGYYQNIDYPPPRSNVAPGPYYPTPKSPPASNVQPPPRNYPTPSAPSIPKPENDRGSISTKPWSSVSSVTKDGLYLDASFPPQMSSLTASGNTNFVENLNSLVWRRPHEIIENAKMMQDGMSRNDIEQQALGDCWFVSACSALADNPELLGKVVVCKDEPLSGNGYNGGPFKFRFHVNGVWEEVEIDDYLPVMDFGDGRLRLVFSKSTEDHEMWISLLEKAYAKLKGCYENLVGGSSTCALSDLTGGVTEVFILNEEEPAVIWKRLTEATVLPKTFATASCGSLVGESTTVSKEELGLMESHAYSVVKCVSFDWDNQTVKLVRIRNPWASFEYKGPWSEMDPIWNKPAFQKIAQSIGYVEKPDGEFFMEFSNFISLFRAVTTCHVEPTFMKKGNLQKTRLYSIKGEWIQGENAGGCMNYRDTTFPQNPQYYLVPQGKVTSCLISLLQYQPLSKDKQKVTYHHMGFYVYELKEQKTSSMKLGLKHFQYQPQYTRSKVFANFQETVIRTTINQDRSYVIIPCTFEPEQSAQFLLRVYVDGECTLVSLETPKVSNHA